mmetsp:Transcript_34788/g.99947  ORF Transcript_34788/g.99947 Transcript_34788/m.99947 type:complete len:592 (-) Transcript_34788:274-2049(-)
MQGAMGGEQGESFGLIAGELLTAGLEEGHTCQASELPVAAEWRGKASGSFTRKFSLAALSLLLVVSAGSAFVLVEPRWRADSAPLLPVGSQLAVIQANSYTYKPLKVSGCTGSIMTAGLWTANEALLLRAAAYDCPVLERFKEIIEKNTIDKFTRRLAESSDPKNRQEFLRLVTTRKRALSDLHGHDDNKTRAHCFHTFLKQQHADLQAMCARDILEFISAGAIVAELGETAALTCGTGKPKFNDECASAVTAVINKVHRTARFATQLQIRCPKRSSTFDMDTVRYKPDVSYDCEGRVEGVAWEMATIGRRFEASVRTCVADPEEAPEVNYAACATEIAAAVGYLGATGVDLATAGELDCVNMTQYDMALADHAMEGDDEAYEELVDSHFTRGLSCARDIVSSVRTMGLSSMKATNAAGYCGGMSTLCGKFISRAATAFAAVVEAAVLLARKCRLAPFDKDYKGRNIECTSLAGAALKEVGVATALTIDASEACHEENRAAGVCASSIVKALAAFGYLLERAALAGKNCIVEGQRTGTKSYACSQNLEQEGEALLVASVAIGSATANCALPGMARSTTKRFDLNRRFWVPR